MQHRHRSISLAAALLASSVALLGQAADPNPDRFASEIRAFEELDRKAVVPSRAVLFVGSSSIRRWPTSDRFPQLPVINRGFGGSHISDVNHYVRETVLKYRPDVVVFYAGDNDIGSGKTPERVLGDYQVFVGKVLAEKPETAIVFIAIKPSLARWKLWPEIQTANELIRRYSSSRPNLFYADVAPPMIGADGRPRPSLFVEDGLHMTPAGYDIWDQVVGTVVAAAVQSVRK